MTRGPRHDVYEIRIEGHLGDPWADWFDGLAIRLTETGDTVLTGPVVDQAALFGLLKKVRDLGVPLVSVYRAPPVAPEGDGATRQGAGGEMSAQSVTIHAVDPDGKWLYRAGGLSALILGAGYLLTFPLYAIAGGPAPSGAEARLLHYAAHPASWWAILGLMVFTDFLFLPIALALFQALKGVHRGLMLLAVALVGSFVMLDLAVTWSNHAALFTLGAGYAAATTEAQRAALVAAAGAPAAVLDSILLSVYAILTLSAGIFLTGPVMLQGVFRRPTAYLGLAVGLSAVAQLASQPLGGAFSTATPIINAICAMLWIFFVGVELNRLGRVEK